MNVFDQIYRENAWGGVESRSGPGSDTDATAAIVRFLLDIAAQRVIGSVLDLGCGDGFWMPDLPGYVGIDVSIEALTLARRRHPDRDYRLDEGQPYPHCDLVICRDVIQHLSLADGGRLLERIRRSEPTYLLATTYEGGENIDVETGQGYWPNMALPPFNLGWYSAAIKDGVTDVFDKGCWLGLWP